MHRRKLDRKRAFSSIHGTGCAYYFEQDGRYFLGNGDECDSDGGWPFKNPPPEPVQETKAETRLEDMKYGDLRTLYTQLTKKSLPVGIKKEDLIKMIREGS